MERQFWQHHPRVKGHLVELCRYVVLNPVRAGIVKRVEEWSWSSYQATLGKVRTPAWLAADALLANFGHHQGSAQRAYARFVAEGLGQASPWEKLRGQIYLGSDKFMAMMQERVDKEDLTNVSSIQRQPNRPKPDAIIAAVAQAYGISKSAVLQRTHQEAFQTAVYLLRRIGNVPLRQVAELAGISPGRVSQIQASMQGKPLEGPLADLMVSSDQRIGH